MFQFRRFPTYTYLIQCTLTEYCSAGFPHSEISGSKVICTSPKLIAAYHVLHRLLMPRHSPCALISLTYLLHKRSLAIGSHWVRIMQASDSTKLSFYPFRLKKVPQLRLFPSVACSSYFGYFVQFSRCGTDLSWNQFQTLIRMLETNLKWKGMVGPSGLEPPTSRLSVVRSSQLSYGPIAVAACTL